MQRRATHVGGLVAGLLILLGAAAAQAGVLFSGSLQVGVWPDQTSAVFQLACDYASNPPCLSGSTAQSAYLYSGSFFTGAATFTGVPTFGTLHVNAGKNGALLATPSGVKITAPITGSILAGKPLYTALKIPLALGNVGTVTTTGFGGLLTVSVSGSGWHVGAVSTTGTFTSMGAVLPTHTFATTGSWNLTASGNGIVKLVSLSHIKVSGLGSYDYVTPNVMTLVFLDQNEIGVPLPPPPPGLPEPSILVLLAAAGVALAGFGRKRRG